MDARYYEAAVVDSEMPMDRYHEDETYYTILAESEPHAHLAISLLVGDRYEIIEFTDVRPVPDSADADTPHDLLETSTIGYDKEVNAYEVFDATTFRVKYRADGDRHTHRTDTLEQARDWYESQTSDLDDPSRAFYSGVTQLAPNSYLQDLGYNHAETYLST